MAAKSRVAPRNRTEDPFRALQKKADARQKVQGSRLFCGNGFSSTDTTPIQGGRSRQPLGEGKDAHKNFGQVCICYFAHNCNLQI